MSEEKGNSEVLVPGYAGHADARSRRLSDQQIRAWVGEMLAEFAERSPPDGLRDRLDALLLRCEFGDQHIIRAVEDDRFGEPDLAALLEACDRKVVAAASAAPNTGPEGLSALIEGLERAFDERAATIAERLKR